jgi:cysteine-rich repeat protein
MSVRRTITLVVTSVALAWASQAARGIELITNGGFETGDFTGWMVTDLAGGSGSTFIDDADGFTPFSGNSTVGPAAGLFYAVSDQGGPGTHVLSQSFTVPANASSATLSFNMFVNDWSNVGPIDQGLDHNLFPNQHSRVDIMSAAAGAFDTGAGVLANLFLGVDAGFDPNPYTPYVFDITSVVAGGGTFVIRFAESENQFFLNLGVDNVSIDVSVCNADGVIDVGEECDDGNSMNGDGCSQGCRVEPCYTCAGEPSACSPVADGTSCDDQLFCNGADTCLAAACTVHVGDPCTGGVECNDVCNENADSCAVPAATPCTDDGNVCTGDACNGAGVCAHPPADGQPCDDGLFCTGLDLCFGGACSFSAGDPCIFGPECNTVCDEVGDVCAPDPMGTTCFDDGTVCTTDECDGAGTCVHPPVSSGLPCPDDGNQCTIDQCDGAGMCNHPPSAGGTPCSDDGNDCTDDECDGAAACVHPALPNGTGCDDVDACTQTDQCQAGNCVGSNPIVCAAPLCKEPGTCDPTSGACTSCPAGYSQGNGGCQKTYAIDVTLLDNQPNDCLGGGEHLYSDCGTPFGFHWTDTGDTSVGVVSGVDIQFESGVECSGFSTHAVQLNAATVGSYSPPTQCTCPPAPATQLLEDVASATYVKGGLNAVSIDSVSCDGLSQDGDGTYAIVTVTYEDPGLSFALRTGCRQALKSKLNYKSNANDAKDKLKWKWGKGAATTQTEFGNPTASADYELCIFRETNGDPTLLIGAQVPASASAWKALGSKGYKYIDLAATAGGVKNVLLKGGAEDKAKLLVKGKGMGLADPTLPLGGGTTGIRAQLTNQANGFCWESEFPFSSISADDQSIKAKLP